MIFHCKDTLGLSASRTPPTAIAIVVLIREVLKLVLKLTIKFDAYSQFATTITVL